MGEELETKNSHGPARLLLRQPMHEWQLGMELDWKPTIGGRQKEPLAGDSATLVYEATLIGIAADVLKHGRGMHKIECFVSERQIQAIGEDKAHAGVKLLEEPCVIDATGGDPCLIRMQPR